MTKRERARLQAQRDAHWDHYRINELAEGDYQCRQCQAQWSIRQGAWFTYSPGFEYCPNGCNRDVT